MIIPSCKHPLTIEREREEERKRERGGMIVQLSSYLLIGLALCSKLLSISIRCGLVDVCHLFFSLVPVI